MVGLVVAAHGRLAQELVATAEQIMGACPRWRRSASSRARSPETIRAQMRAAVKDLDHGEGVLVLADLFGGTPCKESLLLCEKAERRGAGRGQSPHAAQGRLAPEGAPTARTSWPSRSYTYAQRNIRFASELVRDARRLRHVPS